MQHTLLSPSDGAALERRVLDIERRSSAEIVLVIARASSDYKEVDHLCAAAAAFLVFIVALIIPQPVSMLTFPIEMLAVYILVLSIAPRFESRRFLISRRFATEEVRRRGRALFVERKVHRTSSRIGVLVYISLLEQCGTVVPDIGVESKVSVQILKNLDSTCLHREPNSSPLELSEKILTLVERVVCEALPASSENPNELPNEVCSA